MANVFDQFDAAPAATPTPTKKNPFDAFDPAVGPAPTPTPTPTPASRSVPAGDWRTQATESTLPGGRVSRTTSPSDIAMFLDGAPHAFGVALRNAGEGIASLPSLLMEGAAAASDRHHAPAPEPNLESLIKEGQTETSSAPEEPFNMGTILSDAVGLPKPEGDFENTVSAIQQGATSAVMPLAAGKLVEGALPAVSKILTSAPKLQIASGASGAFAGEEARQFGYGPEGQVVASLAGGIAPFANPATLLRAPVQALAGGGDKMRARIQDFLKAGDYPTISQATQNPAATWLENILGGAPISNLIMRSRARNQANNIGNALDEQANKLAPNATKMEVGQKIAEDMAVKRGQNSTDQNALYQRFFDLLPAGRNTRIDVPNFRAALDELTRLEPGAPALSGGNVHPAIAKLRDDFLKDSGGGPLPLPYDTIRAIKTRLSEALNFDAATKPVNGQQVSRLTGAMSEDLKAAASSASPEARVALDEANAFTAQMHKDYDALTGVVQKAADGDFGAVYNAATAGTRDGNRMIETVKRQLDPNGKKMLASFFVRQLARGSNATRIADEAAGSAGETTSIQSLLKNWNALSPEAKRSFANAGEFGPEWADHMTSLSKVASNIATGAKQYANNSDSAGRGATYFFLSSLGGAVASGRPGAAATIAGLGGALPASVAGLMTSRRVVNFLAKNVNKPVAAIPSLLNQLSVQANRTNDPELQKLHDLLREQLANQNQPATQKP
jgi:hypothetical protein